LAFEFSFLLARIVCTIKEVPSKEGAINSALFVEEVIYFVDQY